MEDEDHRCGHPGGKVHPCGCDEPKSHRASVIGCQEFSDRPMVFVDPVDVFETPSHFVKVKEMDSAAAEHLGQIKR